MHSYLGRIFKPIISLICVLVVVVAIALPAHATLKDDHYDGSIFALYGGNGSIVPPKVSLARSLSLGKPALLAFYVDDSYDCKLYTPLLNDMQALYGKAVSIIPISVDSFNITNQNYQPTEEPYYYRGFVPQTVLISAEGKVLFDREGKPEFDDLEAVIKQIPGLPSPDPKILQRKAMSRSINEVNP